MKTLRYGIPALFALVVVGLAGCETTVEEHPATPVNTHTTTIVPGPATHSTTVIPGPSTNTNTTTEKTTVLPGGDGSGSSSSSSSSTTTKTP